MKSIAALWVMLLLLTGQYLAAQNLPAATSGNEEFYFSFRLNADDDLQRLTRVISIDNVRNDTVWAYANTRQFLEFSSTGREIKLLPHPGYLPGVAMADHITAGAKTVWNFYPTYTAYEDLMNQFQTNYPTLCQVTTLTTLASGRKIMVAKISDNVATDEGEPEFLYSSSIHGDETTGYVLMLHLIDYLLTNYGTNAEATSLINGLELYICPLANPDGTYYGGNSSVSGARRANINGVDLNRNYRDPEDGDHPDGNAWQPETVTFMDYAASRHFTAGANFHGGAEVVNYPWDTWATLAADDNWWQFVSREYADTVHLHAPSTYMDGYVNGITNGFAWYTISGGRQDYMNYFRNCREVTIEISNTKLLPAAQLEAHWTYNYRSLILLLKQAMYGLHGTITDAATGLPVQAKVFINGHDIHNSEVYSSTLNGDYHRLLKGGSYTLTVSADDYITQTIPGVVITDRTTTNLNIQLVQAPQNPSAFTATAVSESQINLAWVQNATGNNVLLIWSPTNTFGYPVNGTSYQAGNQLTGGGTVLYTGGANGFSHAALTPGTTVYYRLFSADGTNTYSTGLSASATTTCGLYNTLPFNESFVSTSLPACWTQIDNQGNGQVWQFGTFTGQSPNPALTGNYAYLNSDAYGSGNTQNADLITPTLDFSAYSNVSLQFQHYFKSYTGSSGKLYYSTNNGNTWTLIQTWTTTTASNPTTFNQTVAAVAGQSQVKFRWNYTGSFAYYWALDNIVINGTFTGSLTASPSERNVTAPAGTTDFAITSNVTWTANSGATWCTATPSGTGSGQLVANYDENTSTADRTATIVINSPGLSPVSVSVIQAGAPPSLTLAPLDQWVSAASGNVGFTLESNTDWVATSSEPWCSVTPSGSGNSTLTAVYESNPGTARSAVITVAATGTPPTEVTLHQAAAEPSGFAENFSAHNIVLHWTDATGEILPDGYLIRMSSTAFAAIAEPVDGIAIADGPADRNVAQGVQTVWFQNLTPGTAYYFKMFAYKGSGNSIVYKRGASVPQVSISTTEE